MTSFTHISPPDTTDWVEVNRKRSRVNRATPALRFDLFSLPREIRDRIYFHIVTKGELNIHYNMLVAYRGETDDQDRKRLIGPQFGDLQKVNHNCPHLSLTTNDPCGIQSRIAGLSSYLSILLTNRQVSNEAIQVLYGDQAFNLSKEQSEAFHLRFIPSIGARNISYIRRINMTMPECLKWSTTMMYPRYVAMFNQMPKLKELIIGTHFYPHYHPMLIAVHYSSMMFLAAQVVVSHPNLNSATFLDMGLQEAIQMRSDPLLSPSQILRAQVEIKIRLTARTTQDELAHLLQHGGLMLDAKKLAASTESKVLRCWDPKDWALDVGEAVEVLTTIPRATEEMIAAAEREERAKATGRVKPREEKDAEKIINSKRNLRNATMGTRVPAAQASDSFSYIDSSITTASSLHDCIQSAILTRSPPSGQHHIMNSWITANDTAIAAALSDDTTKSTEGTAGSSSIPVTPPLQSDTSTFADAESRMIAHMVGLSTEEIAAQSELLQVFTSTKQMLTERVGKAGMAYMAQEHASGKVDIPGGRRAAPAMVDEFQNDNENEETGNENMLDMEGENHSDEDHQKYAMYTNFKLQQHEGADETTSATSFNETQGTANSSWPYPSGSAPEPLDLERPAGPRETIHDGQALCRARRVQKRDILKGTAEQDWNQPQFKHRRMMVVRRNNLARMKRKYPEMETEKDL